MAITTNRMKVSIPNIQCANSLFNLIDHLSGGNLSTYRKPAKRLNSLKWFIKIKTTL